MSVYDTVSQGPLAPPLKSHPINEGLWDGVSEAKDTGDEPCRRASET